jgi:hypothetical protein
VVLVALQELQAEAEALSRDANQLSRDAVAFEQPEPDFAQLPPLLVYSYPWKVNAATATCTAVVFPGSDPSTLFRSFLTHLNSATCRRISMLHWRHGASTGISQEIWKNCWDCHGWRYGNRSIVLRTSLQSGVSR